MKSLMVLQALASCGILRLQAARGHKFQQQVHRRIQQKSRLHVQLHCEVLPGVLPIGAWDTDSEDVLHPALARKGPRV